MEIQIYIIIAFSIINFICSIWIGKIQKTRIEGLESMLKEQTGTVDIIKALSDLKDVDELKKYTDLKVDNFKMEKEKEVNLLIEKVKELNIKLKKSEEEAAKNVKDTKFKSIEYLTAQKEIMKSQKEVFESRQEIKNIIEKIENLSIAVEEESKNSYNLLKLLGFHSKWDKIKYLIKNLSKR